MAVIAKCDSFLLQSAMAVSTKCDSLFYYEVRYSVITKCDNFFITKCGKKVLSQSAAIITYRTNALTPYYP